MKDDRTDEHLPFLTPVLRRGTVYQSAGKPLSPDRAIAIGRYFDGAKERDEYRARYVADFTNFCKENDIEGVITPDKGKDVVRVLYQLTPVIRFPAFFITFHGSELVVREAATVCTGNSKSKLWISLSLRDHDEPQKLDVAQAIGLYKTFEEYFSLRAPGMTRFYADLVAQVLREQGDQDNFAIEECLSIVITSLETNTLLDDLLKRSLGSGRELIFEQLEQKDEIGSVLTAFFLLAQNVTKVPARNHFNFHIQNTTPLFEGEHGAVPYIVEGRESLRRLALLLSRTDCDPKTSRPVEQYFTLGSRDQSYTDRTNRNPDITSRHLMQEVGRVY